MSSRRTSLLIRLSLASIFTGFSSMAFAAGFQLMEANGAGTGDYYAGGAASALDASTAFFNPAGLVLIPNQQVVLSGVNIFSDVDVKGSTTWSNPSSVGALNHELGTNYPDSYTAYGSRQAGGYAFIPGFDYAAPINSGLVFGFSEAVPFGLSTDYGQNSQFSYETSQTSVQVIDLSPSLGFKITDKLSGGFGVDADHVDATFDSVAGLPVLGSAPNTYNTVSDNDASGWGYGWHTGLLYQFTPDTRVGIDYRSKVSVTVDGTSSFQGPLAGGPTTLIGNYNPNVSFDNSNLTASTTLPASTMLSVYHQFNPVWATMASVVYTQWSVFNSLTLNNVEAANAVLGPEQIDVYIPQGFRNTWRAAVGASYQPDENWLFRAGLGYDESPTVNEYRNLRLPDGNRFATAIGAHYQFNKELGADLGWTHLFIQDGQVNDYIVQGSQITTTTAKAESSANLIGLQLTWNII